MSVWRRVTSTLAVALTLSAVLHVPSLTRGASACIVDVIAGESIRVDAVTVKKAYRVGDTAEIRFSVSRPGREDAAGLGVPVASPVSRPAPELEVGIFVTVGDEFVYAFGDPTDEQGRSSAKVDVPPVGAGIAAEVLAVAWKTQLQGPCFIVVEQGSIELERAFVVSK